jgi:hypothetical protein
MPDPTPPTPTPPVTVYDALKWPAGVLIAGTLWAVFGDFLVGAVDLLLHDPLRFLLAAALLAGFFALATLVFFAPLVFFDWLVRIGLPALKRFLATHAKTILLAGAGIVLLLALAPLALPPA